MEIVVEEIHQPRQNEVIVTVASRDRGTTTSMAARELAQRAASAHLGRPGFDKYGAWSYRNPPEPGHPHGRLLTESESTTPGVQRPGGTHRQELIFKGGV